MDAVYGFGVSAHSFDGVGRRWSNKRDTNQYVDSIETGVTPLATDEYLNSKQLSSEFAFLSLRLREGLNLEQYRTRFGKDLIKEYERELDRLKKANFIAISEESVVLTERGMLFSNEVFEVFV
jgi:oxygen-independent coproporphyrinogen-3 oxidase